MANAEYEPGWCPRCGEPEEKCKAQGGCADVPDDDDRDYYDSLPDDDGSEFEFDCAMDARGNCGKAGSEECDWECPYRNAKRN